MTHIKKGDGEGGEIGGGWERRREVNGRLEWWVWWVCWWVGEGEEEEGCGWVGEWLVFREEGCGGV